MATQEDSQPTATQPELKKLMTDIFGFSDDDEDSDNEQGVAPVAAAIAPAAAAAARQPVTAASRTQHDEAEIFGDSDNEDVSVRKPSKLARLNKGRKDKREKTESADAKKRKRTEKPTKRKGQKQAASAASSSRAESNRAQDRDDDNDSYASEPEVSKTAEDEDFIDNADEDRELLEEYEKDNPQHFSDERPDDHRKKHADDEMVEENVVDEALRALKKQRSTEIGREDRQRTAEQLVDNMRRAALDDKELRRSQRPALEKLRLLPVVKQLVSTRQLQEELLEQGILTSFKTWLEPPAQGELPTLEIRMEIYKMLKDLPCEANHLSKSQVGHAIMALYKHDRETLPNKKLLESIIQKWSRLIFTSDHHDERAMEQQGNQRTAERRAATQNRNVRLDDYLRKKASTESSTETYARVRVPLSRGFNFKVKPDFHPEAARATSAQEGKNTGGVRARLLKKAGVRSVEKNFRAEKVSIGGRDHYRTTG